MEFRRLLPVLLFLALGLTLCRVLLAALDRFFYYTPDAGWYAALNFLMLASWAFLVAGAVVRLISSRFSGAR